MVDEVITADLAQTISESKYPITIEISGKKILIREGCVTIDGKDFFLLNTLTEKSRQELIEAGEHGKMTAEKPCSAKIGEIEMDITAAHVAVYRLECSSALIKETGIGTNIFTMVYHHAPCHLLITGIMNLECSLISSEEFLSRFPNNTECYPPHASALQTRYAGAMANIMRS